MRIFKTKMVVVMEYKEEYLILSTDTCVLLNEKLQNYVAHLVCNAGKLCFTYHECIFECTVGQGLISVPGQITEIQESDDLQVRIVLTHIDFHYMATPQNNYGIQGTLSLFLNPVIQFNSKEHALLNQDIDNLVYRQEHTELFRHDVLQCATQMLFLDFFQPHARVVSSTQISTQQAQNMMRFINLLQEGAYIEHREVSWYADQLCMTPKYLSEISQKCSGTSATYWIQRFTTTEILRRLKNRQIPITDIIEEFKFCTPSHFSRYVVQHIGKNRVNSGLKLKVRSYLPVRTNLHL